MRSLATAAAAGLAVIASGWAAPSWSQTAPAAAWSTYRNDAFHFIIDTPVPPKIELATSPTVAGPMPVLQGAMDLGARGALQITALDVSQLKTDTTPDAMLEGAVQGALNAASLVKDYEITITKGPRSAGNSRVTATA